MGCSPSTSVSGVETKLFMSARTKEDLIKYWRTRATEAREEAMRIRSTINEATDAEMRCNLRAEMWERCANDLETNADAAV
jgi:hypothetical protein